MIIGEISIAPVHYRTDWRQPDYNYDRYMPPMIPDWGSDIRIDIQLTGTRAEWITLLRVPVARSLFYTDYRLTTDIRLTQQIINDLSRVGISQEQIEEVQRIFDECNESEEVCCMEQKCEKQYIR